MGHKGNRCKTEDGAATYRTTLLWRRCAGSDCFLVNIADIVSGLHQEGNWNEAHEVMPASQDHDSSDKMTTNNH